MITIQKQRKKETDLKKAREDTRRDKTCRLKEATLEDLESTYCCISETSSNLKWMEGLVEARGWFRMNLNKYVEGYHLMDEEKDIGYIYYSVLKKHPFLMRLNPMYLLY